MANLAVKYRPTGDFSQLTEQESTKQILEYQAETRTFVNAYLFSGASGCGKAQPNFCKVKTESGDIEIGNIKIGDKILGSDGKSQIVTNVYPQGMRDYVRVDFTDGTYTYCDYGHLWTYTSRKGKSYTETLREIEHKYGTSFRLTIPTIKPVQYPEKDLPMHPYVLGALLGNGNFGHSPMLYDYYGDVYDVCRELLGDTVTWKEELNRNCPRYSIHNSDWVLGTSNCENKYNTILRDLGLWGTHARTKFIPQIYLYGSVEQRLWLLRGLMDTDGTCVLNAKGTRCKIRYTTVSTQLREDIKYLCRSLGIAVHNTYKAEDCTDISIISKDINPFYVRRKADKYRQASQNYKKVMCHIEPMGKTECTCIRVSNEDELYITNDFIVTHNTTSARIFADMINGKHCTPVELDAASNNGVDQIRDICNQAQTRSMDSEYKVIIVDECFPSNTLISTTIGEMPIKNVVAGQSVKSMYGYQRVSNVFANRVLTNRLCCVTLNTGKNIITTVDHLFFTSNGWISAVQLRRGDIVYGNNLSEDLSVVSECISDKTQDHDILWKQVPQSMVESGTSDPEKDCVLRELWESISGERGSENVEQDLFEGVQMPTHFKTRKTDNEFTIWTGVTETVIRADEVGQSYVVRGNLPENEIHKDAEWHMEPGMDKSWGEWEIYYSADALIRGIRRWMDTRVPRTRMGSNTELSYVIQSRPWLSRNETCDRGGWQNSSRETAFVRRKEDEEDSRIWVDHVEVYERGHNDRLFLGSFSDTELSEKYVTMYDLEVENEHCYFADGILVHNCHMLSTQGWNAFLKTLEEPPATSIFILCTTNPEKIPPTILGRVQRYNFQRISLDGICKRLEYIVNQEQNEANEFYNVDKDAIAYIAKIADGGMRDAIQLLDKCLSYNKELSVANVVKALGVADYEAMFHLASLLYDRDGIDAMIVIEDIYEQGIEIKQFMKSFLEFTLDVNKYAILQDFKHIKIPSTQKEYLDNHTATDSKKIFFNKLLAEVLNINQMIKWEKDAKTVVEARLALFAGGGEW